MIGTIQVQDLMVINLMGISNHRTLCHEHSKEEIAWFFSAPEFGARS